MKKPLFLVLAFLLILTTFIVNVNAVYPYENFLQYEEYDPLNRFSVKENSITHGYYSYELRGYVRNDFGVDYFGSVANYSFSLDIEGIDGNVYVAHWSNDSCDQWQDSDYSLGVSISEWLTDYVKVSLVEKDALGGTPYVWNSDYYAFLQSDRWLHFRVFKNNLDVWLEIYSDSYFSNLLDNLTLTLHDDISYRYMYAIWAGVDGKNIATMYNLILRADLYKVDLNIYAGDKVYTGWSKPILIDTSHYGVQTAWILEGEHSLVFDSDAHNFYNWTGSANVTVTNSTAENTTLTVSNYGNLTLYMSMTEGEAMFNWVMNRTLLWLGLIGIIICMICPVVAFTKIKRDDLEGGFLWFLGIFILGIPFIVAWLWG